MLIKAVQKGLQYYDTTFLSIINENKNTYKK